MQFTLLSPENGNALTTIDITSLVESLQRSFGIDLASAFPQVAIAEDWHPDLIFQVIAQARLNLVQILAKKQLTTVEKPYNEVTPEDRAAWVSHTDLGNKNDQAWVSFTLPVETAPNPVYTEMQTQLDALADFIKYGEDQHALLRNMSYPVAPPTEPAPLVVSQEGEKEGETSSVPS